MNIIQMISANYVLELDILYIGLADSQGTSGSIALDFNEDQIYPSFGDLIEHGAGISLTYMVLRDLFQEIRDTDELPYVDAAIRLASMKWTVGSTM
jgi:hypothetical protein